jgi:hypothetical protein
LAGTVSEVGYWSGLAAFASAVAYDVVQILQVAGVLRFPLDEILIYGTSLCIVVPFVLEMLALHHLTLARQAVLDPCFPDLRDYLCGLCYSELRRPTRNSNPRKAKRGV